MVTKKQIAKEIGKDVGRGLEKAAQTTAGIACIATYPIIGNLSNDLQERIQEKLPQVFHAENAYNTSRVFNYLIRIPTITYLASLYGYQEAAQSIDTNCLLSADEQMVVGAIAAGTLGFLASLTYTSIENVIRKGIAKKNQKTRCAESPDVCASLVGKIVSLPFEGAFYVHNGAQKYLENVKARIEAREKTSGNLEDKTEGGRE